MTALTILTVYGGYALFLSLALAVIIHIDRRKNGRP